MEHAFFDPSRLDAFTERLAGEGIAVDRDTVELAADQLSGAELRLWFIEHLEPGTPTYVIAAGLRLRGPLDLAALGRAATAVVARHEALRCRFPSVSGIPAAEVVEPSTIDLEVEPIAGRDPRPWAEASARAPFDLATGPLVRLSVGRIADDDHLLVVAIHHIVVDGEGLDVVLDELLRAYAGAPLPGAVDRRRVLEPSAERVAAELGYWREELAGLAEAAAIVHDHPAPAMAGHRGGRLAADLGAGLRREVEACAAQLGTTAAVVYHAAFRCLLALIADDDDLAVGCPVNLREPSQAEAVGNFVNTLVIRSRLTGDPPFAGVVDGVGDALRRALAHRRVGFDRVVLELAPERNPSRSPLFQVSFSHHASPLASGSTVGELTVEPFAVETGTAMFDLGLQIAEWRDSVGAHLSFRSDLYEEETARRLLDAYRRILAAAASDPSARLSALPLPESADDRLAAAYRRRRSAPPADRFGLAGRVAAAAAASPGATALVAGERRVSYAELEARSVELAAALDRLDLGPEAPVALLLPRDVDLVAAMLACARVGRPFVPLDPEHPPGRTAQVLEAAAAAALIATGDLAGRLTCRLPPVVDPARVRGGSSTLRPVDPGRALYVIFTSGSTGTPKGVVVTHANLLALLDSAKELYQPGAADVWAFGASCAFDFSVWEIWPALTTGGRVVVLDRPTVRDPERLLAAVARHGVTALSQTPSAFRPLQQLLIARGRQPPASLRLVFFGAEALAPAELRGWFELVGGGGPRLVNMYGITETTVHVTTLDVGAAGPSAASPIGVPLPHASAVVLDRRLRPVPAGIPGELYVGGLGVARGYAGQPGLTAARFVPDPSTSGGRLYRSGDRARWNVDGSLEYLGRTDDQLKVRGFRVEPGEVESALLAVDGVAGAAVVLREGRLAGFVVGDVDPAEVRARLARTLPDHMVPARLETVPALPLTANGKLDRRALPAPGPPRRENGPGGGPPRTRAERVVADAYRDLLGLAQVAVDDDFFQLGGDSILAVQLAARATAAGLTVTVADVFARPVLADLAALATPAAPAEAEAVAAFSLVADGDRDRLPAGLADAYPLSSVQLGMLFHQGYGGPAHPYHVVTTFEIGAPLDRALLQAAFDHVYARHAALRTSFDLERFSEPLQLVWPPEPVPLVVHDVRDRSRADQERAVNDWMAAAYRTPLPLGEPPLLRPHVHVAGDDGFWLSFVECHAIIDGWSLHVVIRELLGTYEALLAGRDLPAPTEPAVGGGEHVAAERAAAADGDALAFFRERFRGADACDLSVLAGPAETSGGDDIRRLIPLPAAAQRRLEERTRETGIPLKSMLMALHVAVVAALLDIDDVVIGTSFNGRPELPGAEDACGMYLNRLPLRLRVGRTTWRELALAAFEQETATWRHRRFPGAAIVSDDGDRIVPSSVFLYNRFRPLASLRDSAVEVLGNAREMSTDNVLLTSHWDHEASDPSEHLALTIQVRPELAASLEVIATVYRQLLAAMVEQVDAPVAEVPPADQAMAAAIARLQDTGHRFADAATPLHRLVERVAREQPGAPAVTDDGQTLTYADLDQGANRLARTLRRAGLGLGDLACLAVARDWRLPVAVLAVLKAGAAFVPIDAAYPEERRRAIAAATPARIVVDDQRLAALMADARGEDPGPLEADPPAGSACYVIFTSGSTGSPKGVVVPHRGIVNFLLSIQRRHPLTADDAVLLKAAISFDASLRELLWPLVAGARIVVAPPGSERDPARLVERIEDGGVTVCHFVPSMLREFVDAVPAGRLERLRLVFAGGETLTSTLARDWEDRFAGRLVNLYGPTEASVDVSAHAGGPGPGTSVPIGAPLANNRLHVLNPALQLVPFGVRGELYLGGAQLADGYLGEAGLTAAQFVPDPFGAAGARMYRTGDRARRLPDGLLEFLGRADDQLKIRGFRIEPGEVEAALLTVPGVTAAAAAGRDGRLVGFVVGDVDGAAVRAQLAAWLPDHLVPSLVLVLDRLPRTANGKVDRRALPAPEGQRDDEVAYLAPRNQAEEILAAAFGDILGLERVGVLDNFFELGGDSIRSLRVVARARSAGLQLTPQLVFEHQTIAAIAPHCDLGTEAAPDAGPARPAAGEPDLSQAGLDPEAALALVERVREAWK